MTNFINRISNLQHSFDERETKKLNIEEFLRMLNKVKDINDSILDEKIQTSLDELDKYGKDSSVKMKLYFSAYNDLKKYVRDTYKFVAKGTLQGEMLAMGVALGVALGAPMTVINPAFIGIGIPIGVAIGAALGNQKEKQAEEEGRLY